MNGILRTFTIEFRKQRRTGVVPLMLAVGILGAGYAFVSFIVRKDALFGLPLEPMDVLLTQLYGMILVLNMFGVIAAASMIYHMEFQGNAVKKMYMLPTSVPAMYFCKFFFLTALLFLAISMQNLALAEIGLAELPQGAFSFQTLLSFAGYSFITSMPVLSFMTLIASRFENMWVPIGVGVAGFLSGMALAVSDIAWLYVHPFVVMLKPAVARSARPDTAVVMMALVETAAFILIGLWEAKKKSCE